MIIISPRKERTELTIRPKECQTCTYSRGRMAPKGVKILICVYENPKVDLQTSRAVWPIVEHDEVCRRHKFNNKDIKPKGKDKKTGDE